MMVATGMVEVSSMTAAVAMFGENMSVLVTDDGGRVPRPWW